MRLLPPTPTAVESINIAAAWASREPAAAASSSTTAWPPMLPNSSNEATTWPTHRPLISPTRPPCDGTYVISDGRSSIPGRLTASLLDYVATHVRPDRRGGKRTTVRSFAAMEVA